MPDDNSPSPPMTLKAWVHITDGSELKTQLATRPDAPQFWDLVLDLKTILNGMTDAFNSRNVGTAELPAEHASDIVTSLTTCIGGAVIHLRLKLSHAPMDRKRELEVMLPAFGSRFIEMAANYIDNPFLENAIEDERARAEALARLARCFGREKVEAIASDKKTLRSLKQALEVLIGEN